MFLQNLHFLLVVSSFSKSYLHGTLTWELFLPHGVARVPVLKLFCPWEPCPSLQCATGPELLPFSFKFHGTLILVYIVQDWAFLLGSRYKYKSHLLKCIMSSHRCRRLGDILSTLHLQWPCPSTRRSSNGDKEPMKSVRHKPKLWAREAKEKLGV